jgi:flagellar biosynthesis protein FlhF
MRLETFRGPEPQRVFAEARAMLGEDAMIIRTRVLREGGSVVVEVIAAASSDVESFRRQLEPHPLPLPRTAQEGSGEPLPNAERRAPSAGYPRPYTVALVGPTGAGKTTTVAKLAVHPQAFGGTRVGLLTLDTFRVGALEQLYTYAEIAELPMEVVYDDREVEGALARLAKCDVILVDTPGRSPRLQTAGMEWQTMLRHIAPDETHLVIPASIRVDIALLIRDSFVPHGATHLLLSKLDEVPSEFGVADLALRLNLPARWVTDGQEIPTDLRPAGARILASLGLAPETADVKTAAA